MASATTDRALIPDEDLPELLSLLEGADTVELKLTVPESEQRSAVMTLGLDPLQAQVRLVYFFDTPDLDLNRAGVVVRARRVKKGDDSVVKLRPVVPDQMSARVRGSEGFGVEVDAMPGGFVCSGSMKRRGLPEGVLQEVAAGERPLRKLFSKEQRRFYAEHAPAGIGLDDLTLLGPIFVLKLKFSPDTFGRKMVVELWLYPDNSRVLELSTKCAPSEAFQVAAEARALLTEQGVSLSGHQEPKTGKALAFFAAALR